MANEKLSAIIPKLIDFTKSNLRVYVVDDDGTPTSEYFLLDEMFSSISYIIEVALAQLDSDIKVSTGIAKFPIPEALTFDSAFIRVDTAPVGSSAVWDINIGGATVLSTKITIEAGELTSLDAASQPVFSTTTAVKDAACTIDCDQIGATTAGQNPVLVIIYKKN